MNWNEKALHRAMGWGAMLVGMPWLLTRREINQNPPENKANPVMWVAVMTDDYQSQINVTDRPDIAEAWRQAGETVREYWGATRVRDGQKDTHDYAIGFSIAWPFIFGMGLLVGWLIFA